MKSYCTHFLYCPVQLYVEWTVPHCFDLSAVFRWVYPPYPDQNVADGFIYLLLIYLNKLRYRSDTVLYTALYHPFLCCSVQLEVYRTDFEIWARAYSLLKCLKLNIKINISRRCLILCYNHEKNLKDLHCYWIFK